MITNTIAVTNPSANQSIFTTLISAILNSTLNSSMLKIGFVFVFILLNV